MNSPTPLLGSIQEHDCSIPELMHDVSGKHLDWLYDVSLKEGEWCALIEREHDGNPRGLHLCTDGTLMDYGFTAWALEELLGGILMPPGYGDKRWSWTSIGSSPRQIAYGDSIPHVLLKALATQNTSPSPSPLVEEARRG